MSVSVDIVQALIAAGAPALTNLILTVVAGLIGMAGNSFRKKVENQLLDDAIYRVQGLAHSVVTELNQTMVEKMREVTEDGKLSSSDARAVLQTAIKKVTMRMDNRSIDRLKKELGGETEFYGLVRTNLEAAVSDAKRRRL